MENGRDEFLRQALEDLLRHLTETSKSWTKEVATLGMPGAMISDVVINAHFALGIATYLGALQKAGRPWPEIINIMSEHLLRSLECQRSGVGGVMDVGDFFGKGDPN